jgi:hypothetical protein
MSAKERAEARRKALLNGGGDRLKKLTSSARSEGEQRIAPHEYESPRPAPVVSSFVDDIPERRILPTDIFSNLAAGSFDATNPAAIHNSFIPAQASLPPTTEVRLPSASRKGNALLLLSHLIVTAVLLAAFAFFYEPRFQQPQVGERPSHPLGRWALLVDTSVAIGGTGLGVAVGSTSLRDFVF